MTQPDSGLRRFAFALLLPYIAVVFSRLPESVGGLWHLPLVMIILIGAATVVACGVLPILAERSNVVLLLFTTWMVLCVPFSVYRGGSVDMLEHLWSITLVLSICMAALPTSVADCRRMMYAMGAGTVLILITYALLGNTGDGRAGTSVGTLGNPNLLALELELGLPFLAVPLARGKAFSPRGVICFLLIGIALAISLRTGSRAGLLALMAMSLVVFLTTSLFGKLRMAIIAILGLGIILAALPAETTRRYLSLFSDSTVDLGAEESSEARKKHLEQSWRLTLANPVFGVGPGMFIVASADESKERRERSLWRETHNTYTQVSSEEGFPGVLLYLTLLGMWVVPTVKLYRRTRRDPGDHQANRLALYLLVAFAGTLVNAFFASAAYNIYLPVLGGLSVALVRCSRAESAARVAPSPAGRRLGLAPVNLTLQPAMTGASAAPPAPGRKSNPIRFGRPRVR